LDSKEKQLVNPILTGYPLASAIFISGGSGRVDEIIPGFAF
jgi:hypothetical protein